MFRTRDFVLLFVTIVFLVVAIGTTIFSRLAITSPITEEGNRLKPAETADTTYTATVSASKILSREEQLVAMRQKVAESGELVFVTPEAIVKDDTESQASDDGVIATSVSCPAPTVYAGQWPRGVVFELAEGARLVYVASEGVTAVGASTSELVVERDVLIQLPVPFGPAVTPSCPVSNVIGVAQDGSLIRNSELSLYSVFGEDTLIGYALDGFPIYGVSSRPTDECGGVMMGTYRYYLSDQRDTIVNCYAGTPVNI